MKSQIKYDDIVYICSFSKSKIINLKFTYNHGKNKKEYWK